MYKWYKWFFQPKQPMYFDGFFSIGWWFPNLYMSEMPKDGNDRRSIHWTQLVGLWNVLGGKLDPKMPRAPHVFLVDWWVHSESFLPTLFCFISWWRWKYFFAPPKIWACPQKTTWKHFSRKFHLPNFQPSMFNGYSLVFGGSSHRRNPRAKSHLVIRCVIRRSRRLPENTWIKVQIRQKMRDVICWVSWLVWYLIYIIYIYMYNPLMYMYVYMPSIDVYVCVYIYRSIFLEESSSGSPLWRRSLV